jgi:putative Holliday junction resolvase
MLTDSRMMWAMPENFINNPDIILGFDFGTKYIGVAVGQTITRTASPVTTLLALDGIPQWEEIDTLIKRWKPNVLIVGIPLNMDDTVQLMTFRARRFMKRLQAKFKLPTHGVDERLSSWEAKTHDTFSDQKRKRPSFADKTLHAKAAAILVEQWMAEQA